MVARPLPARRSPWDSSRPLANATSHARRTRGRRPFKLQYGTIRSARFTRRQRRNRGARVGPMRRSSGSRCSSESPPLASRRGSVFERPLPWSYQLRRRPTRHLRNKSPWTSRMRRQHQPGGAQSSVPQVVPKGRPARSFLQIALRRRRKHRRLSRAQPRPSTSPARGQHRYNRYRIPIRPRSSLPSRKTTSCIQATAPG